jgi:hypothetical protein
MSELYEPITGLSSDKGLFSCMDIGREPCRLEWGSTAANSTREVVQSTGRISLGFLL